MEISIFEATKLLINQLRRRKYERNRGTGAVDWEEAAIEREGVWVGVGEVKVTKFGNEGLRDLGEKGRALWAFGRKNVETLVNGVTIVFILRNTTATAPNFPFLLILFVFFIDFLFYLHWVFYFLLLI